LSGEARRCLFRDPKRPAKCIKIRTKTETTSAGEQHVIPGAEKISYAALANRKAEAPLNPKVGQKPADEGLFGDRANQTDFSTLPAGTAAKP
jgi:hypothetical protein